MTPELTALTLAALLQATQFFLMAIPANLEAGTGKTTSPRDADRLSGTLENHVSNRTARLIRAYNNHLETLILFAIACIVITITDQSTSLTTICAFIYFGARLLYIPAYAFGWVPWRSYIWMVAFAATTLMLLAALI